jgi:hypothetical protein
MIGAGSDAGRTRIGTPHAPWGRSAFEPVNEADRELRPFSVGRSPRESRPQFRGIEANADVAVLSKSLGDDRTQVIDLARMWGEKEIITGTLVCQG